MCFFICSSMTKPNILFFIVLLLQCIVIKVGEGGFTTERVYDSATFKDTDSSWGIKFTIITIDYVTERNGILYLK